MPMVTRILIKAVETSQSVKVKGKTILKDLMF